MPDDLPPAWQATLAEILEPRGTRLKPAASAAVRFMGATAEMVAAGWLQRYEDEVGKVHWAVTPWVAERMGYVLVETAEDREPAWMPWDRTPGEWTYPEVEMVSKLRHRHLPDASWLNVPDSHSDPARAEARRRNLPRRLNRRQRREIRERRRAAAERKAG
jgi:hypothetical protein